MDPQTPLFQEKGSKTQDSMSPGLTWLATLNKLGLGKSLRVTSRVTGREKKKKKRTGTGKE